MAESEAFQAAVMQAAIQAATVAVMVLREADARPASGTRMTSTGEACKHRHGGTALRQPSIDWTVPDRYAEHLYFEMEVTNVIQTRTFELHDEEKVPLIKMAKRGWTAFNTNIYKY